MHYPILGIIGTQEIIILLILLIVFIIGMPIFFYNRGRKKGRLEGKLEEMERNRKSN
jgi:hypothetical protein